MFHIGQTVLCVKGKLFSKPRPNLVEGKTYTITKIFDYSSGYKEYEVDGSGWSWRPSRFIPVQEKQPEEWL